MVPLLRQLLEEGGEFRKAGGALRLLPVPGDAWARQAVMAVLDSPRPGGHAVLLLGHYDVVSARDYGALQPWAFQPRRLPAALAGLDLPGAVQADLESGRFLWGRGVLDMKFGLALQLEAVRWLATHRSQWRGRVVLLAVPDEEAESLGMTAALPHLARLHQQGPPFTAAICCEPCLAGGGLTAAPALYHGSAGKMLAVVYCRGVSGHAGAARGLSAVRMVTRVVEVLEDSPQVARACGAGVSPPLCLQVRDRKRAYDLQTAEAAAACFNLVSARCQPVDLLPVLSAAVEEALRGIAPDTDTRLLTWEQAVQQAAAASRRSPAEVAAGAREAATAPDLREATLQAVEHVAQLLPAGRPLTLVCLAPPYYPLVAARSTPADRRLQEVAAQVAEVARAQHGIQLLQHPLFPAVSDLSYLRASDGDLDARLGTLMPLWGCRYHLPAAAKQALDIPCLNLGPTGEGAHSWTERLDLSYSLEVLPRLLLQALRGLLV